MAEEATLDAYDEAEQITGWHTMIADNLTLPFQTQVLGVTVTVESIELATGDEIVALCARDQIRQPIGILDLPCPHHRRTVRNGSRPTATGCAERAAR